MTVPASTSLEYMGLVKIFKDDVITDSAKGHEYRRLMKYFRKKPLLYMSFLFAVIAGISPLLFLIPGQKMTQIMAVPTEQFVDAIVPFLKQSAWIAAICVVIQGLSNLFQALVSPHFLTDISRALYGALMDADIEYFDKTACGALVGRISEGVTYVKDIYVDTMFLTINMVSMSLGGLVVGLVYNWKVMLMFIVFPIALAVWLWGGNKWANHIRNTYETKGTESTEKAVSVITEFRTVKSFDQETWEAERFKRDLDDQYAVLEKVSIVRGLIDMIAICLMMGMMLTMTWYIMREMVRDPQSVDIFQTMCCLMGEAMVALGINRILSLSDDFEMSRLAARNICAIIERKPKINRHEGRDIGTLNGKIEFRDVGFKYESCDQWAVRHLSFTISAGETVAFVGESGCGKSTTLQLLQRFYEIQEGQILVDDVNIREISPISLRRNISIVPQSPVLFTMTVADNIAYGKTDAAPDAIAEAAMRGNAHNFIMELPDNYKTKVQQTSLSGGQKQRICISRAILSPTPILLLDEATAALDTESEQLVQQSLESFRRGKTSIMVAHRLATVVNADRILVFQDGHIVETGTHKNLLDQNGVYANLAKFQLQ